MLSLQQLFEHTKQKLSVDEENEILNKLGFTKEDIETKSEFQDLKNEIDKMQVIYILID